MHDDRADCCAMACHLLAELRREKLLDVEVKVDNKFSKLFNHAKSSKPQSNRLDEGINPFLNDGPNPFLR